MAFTVIISEADNCDTARNESIMVDLNKNNYCHAFKLKHQEHRL